MNVANSDINFFQMYRKMSNQKVAHQSAKRNYLLKVNAPGYAAPECAVTSLTQ